MYEAISRNHLRKNNIHRPSVHRRVGVKSSKAKIYTETPHSQANPLSSSACSTVWFLFPIRRNLFCDLVRSIGSGPAVDLSKNIRVMIKAFAPVTSISLSSASFNDILARSEVSSSFNR